MTISSSLLQLTGRIIFNVADSYDSSLSYILNYFITHRKGITSRANLAIIESYLEKLRELRATSYYLSYSSYNRIIESRAARARS